MSETPLIFKTPRDVLSFIRRCLNDQDVDRLYDAALEETAEFWRDRMFDDLRQIEDSETLEEVFLVDDQFPDDQSDYKMGGHGSRTRHLHLDLIRVNSIWRLKEIWKCR